MDPLPLIMALVMSGAPAHTRDRMAGGLMSAPLCNFKS